jgi:hypothetical protein
MDTEIRVELHPHRANIRRFLSLLQVVTILCGPQANLGAVRATAIAQASLGTALYYLGQQLEP